jgi:dolichol-phosphate mannosyltransferase
VVEVNHRPRTAGQSKYGIGNRLWVGMVDLLGVKWLCARAKNPKYLNTSAKVVSDE